MVVNDTKNNDQVLDKEMYRNAFIDLTKNSIFLTVAVLALQPIIYIILSQAFYGVLRYYKSSEEFIYTPIYSLYLSPAIIILTLLLVILLLLYTGMLFKAKQINFNFDKKEFIVNNIYILFFALTLIWILTSCIVNKDFINKFWDNDSLFGGTVFYICFAIIVASILLLSKKQKRIILEMFLVIGFIVCLISILLDVTGVSRLKAYVLPEAGIFSNRNYFGYYLAIIMPLFAAELYKTKNKYLQVYYGLGLCTSEVALLISLTRGSAVAAVLAIVLMLIVFPIQEKRFDYKTIIIPVVILAVFAISELSGMSHFMDRIIMLIKDGEKIINDDSIGDVGSGRIAIWKEVITSIQSSPMFGVGIARTINPHNEYLQLAAWSGVPALVFYLFAIAALYIKAWIKRKDLSYTQSCALIGAFGYLVSSFFGNGIIQILPFYIIILALSLDIHYQRNVVEIKENETTIECENNADNHDSASESTQLPHADEILNRF